MLVMDDGEAVVTGHPCLLTSDLGHTAVTTTEPWASPGRSLSPQGKGPLRHSVPQRSKRRATGWGPAQAPGPEPLGWRLLPSRHSKVLAPS